MITRCSINILVVLYLIFSIGCDDAQPSQDEDGCKDCPDLVSTSWGPVIPSIVHAHGALSADGAFLAYSIMNTKAMYLTRLADLSSSFVNIRDPNRVQIAVIMSILACPYDPDVFLINCVTNTDTLDGTWRRYVTANNAYLISSSGNIIERVTPRNFPFYGAVYGFSYIDWLPNSKRGHDSLLVGYDGVYLLQESRYIKPYSPWELHLKQSANSAHWFGFYYGLMELYIDLKIIVLPRPVESLFSFALSKNGTKLLLEMQPENASKCDDNIWILDFQDSNMKAPINPSINAIGYRRDFCKYSLRGPSPLFITDSTIALSMHAQGEQKSVYWEVTTKGVIVRQLTF